MTGFFYWYDLCEQADMDTYIGCSGYYYKEWKGQFYPQELPASRWLEYYATHFNTIEINATFYKMPTVKSLSRWYRLTPADFVFTVKANKMFTHFNKMMGVDDELDAFYEVLHTALGEKLKCVLYQFPASVKYSAEMLERIFVLSKYQVLHAIEFRDQSWFREDVYKAIQDAGMIFCNISLPGFPDIFVPDTAANYLRFHGKPVLYKSAYGADGLEWWVKKVQQNKPKELLVYFNNTWFGAAIEDAKIFRKAMGVEDLRSPGKAE